MNNSLTLTVRSTLTGKTTQIVLRDGSYEERMQEYKSKFGDAFVCLKSDFDYLHMREMFDCPHGGVYAKDERGYLVEIGYIEDSYIDIQNLENYLMRWSTQSVPEDYPFWCPALWD